MVDISEIFACTQCGYCCQGETTVSLDEADRERMVKSLAMTEKDVSDKYWRITGAVVQMKIIDGHCIFYKQGCSVHGGRPWRCGQWPLHPSILADENNFHTIAESCPGIKKDIGYKRFCQVLSEAMRYSVVQC